MVVAGLLGALLTLSALHAADDSRPVLVAAHEILPGTVIDSGSLRVARIHADAGVLATLFAPAAIDDLRGRVAVADVHAGSLLTQGDVQAAAAGAAPRAMSFPIPVAAVRSTVSCARGSRRRPRGATQHGPQQLRGDRRAGARVLDARQRARCEDSQDASVTLAVDPDEAARIASALETGSVTLVRSTGAKRLHASAPGASANHGHRDERRAVVTEPEVALVFTAEPWVEELHRYLSDHGGARVRSLVVEQSVALEESYDVLVVSHRWPALTLAFVGDVHDRCSAHSRRVRPVRAGRSRAPCRRRRGCGHRARCRSRGVRARARRTRCRRAAARNRRAECFPTRDPAGSSRSAGRRASAARRSRSSCDRDRAAGRPRFSSTATTSGRPSPSD